MLNFFPFVYISELITERQLSNIHIQVKCGVTQKTSQGGIN